MNGSGEVPHDELGPRLEFEDEQGEAPAAPLTLKVVESRLVLDVLLPYVLSYGDALFRPVVPLAEFSLRWVSDPSPPLAEPGVALSLGVS